MTYEASSEIVDLGTASRETKGAPGTPFPDNYGDRPQEGLSDD
ncbi:benenodin family lasso peptide [Sphingosinicella xenopeptidilytica]|uniref:Benenodin family lasso peptide n=1 Tax=Sphingosinicella xenopeptidilytica TaxID=364098 RepID=A0ABW3C5F7_SPHXN